MKKIMSVLIAVLLLASLGSFAFADEGTGWDDSDEYVTIDLPQRIPGAYRCGVR